MSVRMKNHSFLNILRLVGENSFKTHLIEFGEVVMGWHAGALAARRGRAYE